MPFKVKFMIYEPGKQAPCYTTSDAALARVEYNAKVREQGMALSRYVFEITCEDLTKAEEYVWLVYQVRQAIHKYYNQGRKYADLQASLTLEKQLDDWNLRTRTYLNNHPKCQIGDEKAHSFFLLVEKWREKWHKFFACKKAKSEPEEILREMKRECTDYEKEIDMYVKKSIGLV